MSDTDKTLTYEEAKQLCRKAFDGGATYGSESMRYGVNATAYDWEHWLKKNESLFKPKPTVEQGGGRMSFEQRNADFCKAQTDVQMAYIEAEREVKQLKAENAKLREQTELLVTLLRNDCDIEASWDGLRHFWSIELTDDGCLMRDRACKAEAESAKLRELVDILCFCMQFNRDCDDCKLNGAEGKLNIEACEGLRMLLQDAGIEVPE